MTLVKFKFAQTPLPSSVLGLYCTNNSQYNSHDCGAQLKALDPLRYRFSYWSIFLNSIVKSLRLWSSCEPLRDPFRETVKFKIAEAYMYIQLWSIWFLLPRRHWAVMFRFMMSNEWHPFNQWQEVGAKLDISTANLLSVLITQVSSTVIRWPFDYEVLEEQLQDVDAYLLIRLLGHDWPQSD